MEHDDELYSGGNPLGENEEITVTAKAPSWLRRGARPPVTGLDAEFINKVRRRDDYRGLQQFALGAAMAPVAALATPAVSKAAGAYSAFAASHPGAAATLALGNAGLSAYSLASKDGVRKTAGLIREGRRKDAALSALGDAVDAVGIGGVATKALKSIPFRYYHAWLLNARDHVSSATKAAWRHAVREGGQVADALRVINSDAVPRRALRLRYSADVLDNYFKNEARMTKFYFRDKYRPWLDVRCALTEPFIDRRWALRKTPILSEPYWQTIEAGNTYNDAQGLFYDLRPLSPWSGNGDRPRPGSNMIW